LNLFVFADRSMQFTRRELYDLVWSKPLATLAEEFGISDVGLAKICDRHRVPTPQRGYWAKVAAGQKVKKTYFAELNDPILDSVEISATVSSLPEPVKAFVVRQRAERIERRVTELKLAQPPAEQPAKAVAELHPTVRRTAQTLRSRAAQEDAVATAIGNGECGISVGVDSIQRCIRILDLLAQALEQRGLALEPLGKKMRVAVAKDGVEFELKEVARWVDYTPTAHDLAYDAKRNREIDRYYRAGIPRPEHLYGPSYPSVVEVRTGQLFIAMGGYDSGLRHKWADGKKQTLETVIPSVVDGIELLIASRKAWRERQEENERIWAERQRRRELAQERAKREQARETFTSELIQRHLEIRRLQQWLDDAGPAAADMPGTAYSRMVTWVTARLEALVISVSADGIDRQLTEKKLFPADGVDELHDPLGDPPEPTSYW
jgi:hypothetical protein